MITKPKIKDHKQLYNEAKKTGKRPISYSQLSNYHNCPFAWKLQYIDKIRDNDASIHLVFGSAMHTVIQEYLQLVFNQTVKKADGIDFNARLYDEMKIEYLKIKDTCSNPDTFATKKDMIQFYENGKDILDYLRKNRMAYFNTRTEELISIEEPIMAVTDSHSNILFTGFIDLIFRDKRTLRYKIIDIKTSTRGWRKKEKSDFTKSLQLVLYKKYYSKILGVDPKHIDIEFFIVKRLLWENSDFPQKRIQIHRPASGVPTMNKAEEYINKFSEVFDEKGKVDPDFIFKKNGNESCKYCPFKNNDDLCPIDERGV